MGEDRGLSVNEFIRRKVLFDVALRKLSIGKDVDAQRMNNAGAFMRDTFLHMVAQASAGNGSIAGCAFAFPGIDVISLAERVQVKVVTMRMDHI